MAKKKPKFKKPRRKLSRTKLFPKKVMKEDYAIYMFDRFISEAFPNPKKKKEYIAALINGLKNEPDMELKDGN